MRVSAYTPNGTYVVFHGNRHDSSLHTMYDSRWHGQLMGWLASLTLEDEVRQDMSLPRVVCEYEDIFSDELSGLPPPRDIDFHIELHLGTSPISMTPHRMAPVKLQELKVQIQELLALVSIDRALHHAALRFYLRGRRIRPFDNASIIDS